MMTRRDFLGAMSAAGLAAAMERGGIPLLGAVPAGGLPASVGTGGKAIDRFAVIARHTISVKSVAQDSVLSVGNGNFAFNVDCTGVQSMPTTYKMIPLATLSHWGWHSKPMPAGMNLANYRYKPYNFHGRQVPYATDSNGQKDMYDYLRENPHRLNLGRVGLLLDGKEIMPAQVAAIDQKLDLASGIVTSRFTLDSAPVEVITCCQSDSDGIALKISSPLLASGRLTLSIMFGYGSTQSSSDGADWNNAALHQTTIFEEPRVPKQVTLNRTVDATRYGVRVDTAQAKGGIKEAAPHHFVLTAAGPSLETSICFDSEQFKATPLYTFAEAQAGSQKMWKDFWTNGAFIDLGDCTDPRAPELERRIILSQYQTAVHCSGQYPSQETGLLCNSWYGKFHLEMHWWHSVHFSLWGRQKFFGRSMFIYTKLLESARARAKQQGFKGVRWPKMIGPDGVDSPSPIGPILIWQEPHPIYYAELSYRDDPTIDTVKRWRDIVIDTAEFMASYAFLDTTRGNGGQYILGPSLRTVSENNKDADINPTWELTVWRWALSTAQSWLERLGEKRRPEWDDIITKLAPASTKDGVYLMQEGQDTFSKEWAYEHPALLGALGVLPGNNIDPKIMAATVKKVREVWDFSRVWGWDYPVGAMCAARTLQPELAIDFLTMEAPTNRYLPNGCNFQRDNVPAYYPGNGGLLSAIAMMAAGWDQGPTKPEGAAPGFPKDGKWNIRAEGFRKFI
ncbi:MAG TPA: glycoside hydrolase family 65 [Phycisphaerae bacterium]|jgi:hypothetical protein